MKENKNKIVKDTKHKKVKDNEIQDKEKWVRKK